MENSLQEYIKRLSLADNKSLSQKALKVSEEAGELAKAVLPFENAHGTIHRFVDRSKILEESVDVILTSISIAYEQGFSQDEIEEMMWEKAQKWHNIQIKEDKIEFPIPYEIHVTVDIGDWGVDLFKKACRLAKVKPIIIDLETDGKSVMKDVMTSSHFIGDNRTAYLECQRISKIMGSYDFEVLREKIETVPWHPAAPQESKDKMPEDCYFEAHIGCIITLDQKKELNALAKAYDSHLSRNFFKKVEGEKFVNMITLRTYEGTYKDFEKKVEELKSALDREEIEYEKVITEFSIYDTKVSHDFKWLNL